MAYGDLKVRNLIWNTGSGDNTVVLSTLATQSYVTTNFAPKANPTFSGTINGVDLILSGNLTVSGTQTIINTNVLQVEDIHIEIGKVSSPSDTTADGGGIILKASSDRTFVWINSTDAWTSSEHIQVASGKTFIGDGSTLTALNASNLASGTVPTARLGTGTAGSANFLRGDGSWQAIATDKIEEGNTSVETVDTGSDGHVKITTEGTERVRVTNDGKVGINNNNPTVKLAVDGGTTNDATTVQIKNDSTSAYATTDGGLNTSLSLFSDGTNSNQGVGIQLYLQKSGETGAISEIGATRESSGNSNLVFRTRISSSGVNERMRISSAGAIGVNGANYGSSGQVLTSGGASAAPSWTTISAAPEITGTASGSISNNQAVIAKTNGQIEAVTASTSISNPPTGAMISANVDTTNDSYWTASAYDESTNCLVVAWGGWTSFNGYKIRTGVVSANSISWGTTQTVDGSTGLGDNHQFREIQMAASGSGKIAVFLAKNTGSKDLYMQIASISAANKNCTFGSQTELGGNGYAGTSGTYISEPVWMSTSAVACGWRKGGTERGYVRTLSVSGTACTVQSEHEIANNSHQLDGQVGLIYRNNKLVFFGRKIHPGNNLIMKCASISGTSMSWGSVQTDSVIAYKLQNKSATFVADDKFIVAFFDNYNEVKYSRVFSISTTTINSGGTIANFVSSSYSNWQLYWDSDISRVVMASRDTNTQVGGVQKDSVRVQTASISGTSITWGTESALIRNTTNNSEIRETYRFVHDSTLERGLIVGNANGGTNTTYDISIFSADTTTTTTNMTADNFIGFSTAGYSSGQTATIAVVGNTTTKSSLTAGSKHYVQKNGSLSTTADTPSVVAGLALSSTKLLIKPA